MGESHLPGAGEATPVRISYFGGKGSFSAAAAVRYGQQAFGDGSFTLYEHPSSAAASYADVCRHVQLRQAHQGVLPIENVLEGVVTETLDALRTADLRVCGEVSIPIVHHLLSREERLDDVVKVYSHHQAIRQCGRWLAQLRQSERTADVDVLTEASTAVAARRAAHESGAAAIGTEAAAEVHGLHPLAEDIGDSTSNLTRFWVVGRRFADPSGADKTTLLVELENRAGALRDLLGIFAQRNLNLLTIHQRPLEYNEVIQRMEYYWFLDYEGHINEAPLYEAFHELVSHRPRLCRDAKVLGSYPQSTIPGGGRW